MSFSYFFRILKQVCRGLFLNKTKQKEKLKPLWLSIFFLNFFSDLKSWVWFEEEVLKWMKTHWSICSSCCFFNELSPILFSVRVNWKNCLFLFFTDTNCLGEGMAWVGNKVYGCFHMEFQVVLRSCVSSSHTFFPLHWSFISCLVCEFSVGRKTKLLPISPPPVCQVSNFLMGGMC